MEFLTKDEFHDYVTDNRDRQDANKKEIIETLTKTIEKGEARFDADLDTLGGRVTNLEAENTKQNRIAVIMGAITTAVLGGLAFLK